MNTRIPQYHLTVAAATLCLAGCVTVPMAPLVYGSKTVGGLDISTTTTGANPGVSISIGYKRDDLALVPVAVMKQKEGKDGKILEYPKIIRGHDIDSGDEDDTNSAAKQANGDAAAAKEAKANVQRDTAGNDNNRKDAMSVFGSFEGRGMAQTSTQTTGAQAIAANYFSTGVAAQNLARGLGNAAAADQLRKCFLSVKDVAGGVPDADRQAYVKKGMDACSEAGKTVEK